MLTFLAGPALSISPSQTSDSAVCDREPSGSLSAVCYEITFPVMTPSQTETKPTPTLSTIFIAATRSSPSWKTRNVSYSKAENVLYPPRNPIGIKYLQFGLQCALSARRVMTKPIRNDAVILITKVPYGKRAPNRPLT